MYLLIQEPQNSSQGTTLLQDLVETRPNRNFLQDLPTVALPTTREKRLEGRPQGFNPSSCQQVGVSYLLYMYHCFGGCRLDPEVASYQMHKKWYWLFPR